MLKNALLKQIEARLRGLPLAVHLWTGDVVESSEPVVRISAADPRALGVLANPSLGRLARAYVEGWIDLDGNARDILDVGRSLCRADETIDASSSPSWHWRLPSRTRGRDQRNISYHYDVSNEFYGLWLDRRRVYSCAYFEQVGDDLDRAQERKLDHICRKLMLQPEERFLDIGCGWGGLILHAAEHYGVRATGITLSQNQHDYAMELVRSRGLQDRVQVLLMDYRDVPEDEPYDKIASVGMFEHVGRANLGAYFDKIHQLLRPGGLVMNHGITSSALDTEGLGSGISEFVEDYVFPGGELTHVSRVMEEMAQAGIEPLDAENLRPHYARTLWHWVERLETRREEALRLIGEQKYRIWHIYMAGSAYAFERNWMALFQILGGRPREGGRQDYPFNRRHVYSGG